MKERQADKEEEQRKRQEVKKLKQEQEPHTHTTSCILRRITGFLIVQIWIETPLMLASSWLQDVLGETDWLNIRKVHLGCKWFKGVQKVKLYAISSAGRVSIYLSTYLVVL